MALDTEPHVTDATIPAGEALSQQVDLGEERLHRIDLPAGWDAASITLRAAYSDGPLRSVFLETAEFEITTAAPNRSIVISPAVAFGIRYVQIRSGTEALPVNQSAERLLKLVTTL